MILETLTIIIAVTIPAVLIYKKLCLNGTQLQQCKLILLRIEKAQEDNNRIAETLEKSNKNLELDQGHYSRVQKEEAKKARRDFFKKRHDKSIDTFAAALKALKQRQEREEEEEFQHQEEQQRELDTFFSAKGRTDQHIIDKVSSLREERRDEMDV